MAKGRGGRPWTRLVALAKREYPPVCHLCGGAIDTTLHRFDDGAWTLDHVVPLYRGGAPEDLANLRPAHRICNLRKGSRTDYQHRAPKQSRTW